MHKELSKLRESHDTYKTKLRDMELDNDELENTERMINSSLADMEGRYNRAVERTALLESELEDKRRLEEENQRLKDELRDVREELAVVQQRQPAAAEGPPPAASGDPDELKLSDLVVRRSPRKSVGGGAAAPSPAPRPARTAPRRSGLHPPPARRPAAGAQSLEAIRANMRQLQERIQNVQAASLDPPGAHAERSSALPRPRSRLSSSFGVGAPWSPSRSVTPLAGRPETPVRSASTLGDRRKSGSFIPVPSGGLSRSNSTMRALHEREGATHAAAPNGSALPYEFMEHDPSQHTPVSATRRASLLATRRRSLGPGASPVKHADGQSPGKPATRTSPSKAGRPPSAVGRPPSAAGRLSPSKVPAERPPSVVGRPESAAQSRLPGSPSKPFTSPSRPPGSRLPMRRA